MDTSLARFVQALRNADVTVSPGETLDAALVWQHLGSSDRSLLKNGLELALAKTKQDKLRFSDCFDAFFQTRAFNENPKSTLLQSFPHKAVLDVVQEGTTAALTGLVRHVLEGRLDELHLRFESAALDSGIHDMNALRDKSRVFQDVSNRLDLHRLNASNLGAEGDLATGINYVRRYLRDQLQEYVDRHYKLETDYTGKRAVLKAALEGSLDDIPAQYQAIVRVEVERIAEELRFRYKRRQKSTRRGALDVRNSLRRNFAYDGALYNLHWRKRQKREGTLFIVCDVSGSVARISRFFLLLLYQLAEILPDVRSFAFSATLGEITTLQEGESPETAIESALFEWGNGNTDYGAALARFRTLTGQQLNHRSTVVILGDARSNFYPARADVMREIATRAKRVIWLNPETEDQWTEGDSVMPAYRTFCSEIYRLQNVTDLRRVANELVHVR